ncbi:MAG TPA: hypothetical protein ENK99_02015 [Campylobacterales bacterium]|nr:hypothetical protein [Campylobacterales bacterium]
MKKIFVALLLVWGMLYGQADNKIVFRQDVQFQRDTNNEDIRTILKAIAKLNGSQIRIDKHNREFLFSLLSLMTRVKSLLKN